MNHTADPITVVHSANVWLSQTMTWLHTQIQNLPPRIESHIVCDSVANADQFPTRNLVSADRDSALWTLASAWSWQVASRRRSHLLRTCIRSTGADLVHSHFGDRGWINMADVTRMHLKHVVSFYGYDVSRLPRVEPIWRERYREMFASADSFLCEGPHLAQALLDLGCPRDAVEVHHLGIDLDRVLFRSRVWHPGETLRVLIASSFMEKKGIPYAIEALGRIQTRVDLAITIVGDASAQPRSMAEKARILEAIDRSGLSSRTRLLGYQPYAALLKTAYDCHVFLSPSLTASDGDAEGGAPVSVIEMAASGMPVVSTRHCDIPEVLQDGVTGLLADERDVDGLEERLIWLLDNPDAWSKMVTGARRHIEHAFDARTQGARLAMHYERLLTRA